MKWKISSSIVRGSIHGSENCQDNNSRIITDDYSMIVACDGASSVSHAYEASRIAADTFEILVKNCNTRLFDMSDDELKSLICGTVRSALIDAATAAGCDIDQFHTTLAAIICTPESYLAVNIGDGLVGFIPDDKNLGGEALLSPVTGEYANTCHFISENDSERHPQSPEANSAPRQATSYSPTAACTASTTVSTTHLPMLCRFTPAGCATTTSTKPNAPCRARYRPYSPAHRRRLHPGPPPRREIIRHEPTICVMELILTDYFSSFVPLSPLSRTLI